MSNPEVFRVRQEEPEETPESAPEQRETPNLVEERIDGALKDTNAVEEIVKPSQLEEWEIKHGKYGIEYFGIEAIAKTFPISAQFGVIDKYVRSKMDGEPTTELYQQILDGIEREIGSYKLNTYDRIKKLHDYVRIVDKYEKARKLKESFK